MLLEANFLIKKLQQLFSEGNLLLTDSAAKVIATDFLSGKLSDEQLDAIYRSCHEKKISEINCSCLDLLKRQQFSSNINFELINVFSNVSSRPDLKNLKLIPQLSDFKQAFNRRLLNALQRVRNCSNVTLWPESYESHRLRSQHNLLIKPVEYCLGGQGTQCVIGTLRNSKIFLSESAEWFLHDSSQILKLQLPQDIKSLSQDLFIHDNIVIAKGKMTFQNLFLVSELAHPPTALNFDQLLPKQNEANITKQRMRWLLFGSCLFDSAINLANIYESIQHETHFEGIVFIGKFCSRQHDVTFLKDYQTAFRCLTETLRLCEKLLRNKRVILVPGAHDLGANFLPKLPLLPCYTADLSAYLQEINGHLHLASNPTCLSVNFPNEEKSMMVCQSSIIELLNNQNIAVYSPFLKPSLPTSQELAHVMPRLVISQAHVAPLPLASGPRPYIAKAYDDCFTIKDKLPHAIILSEDSAAYTHRWKERLWIGNPGCISRREYMIYDFDSNTMTIKTLVN